ncbi:Na(+)/H(+) exchange regulatory cofactor NHE-RF2-like [Anopheles albimanus]|uniref:PDZ domain-containing protein n=1 Tax=Anopheles albimanus TaxID=7167 RepID=A0A182FU83_ANOAL|nr:Na(+)/H(+) exchange regulatory cofactor NHE-RF2-like [Anopheles albimanus]XP_035786540.1 Na(+)/H(+) exchange regulatory cofactor NHE-RF2-like [Anopheles albimanus]XP_035786541.1 Na(+)/H(+) exchange regulatory cofactor NHE-RF2-like [Anopheles albimanus]
MSSKTNGTTAAAAVANGTPKYEARLCHVVKRADFDGYGFNLHAEKGRPGQYIGKVDDGSPAEGAGLRQGDRIIEVNGHNITTETHKKVVELIKAVPNETRLLVIDPRADANDLKMALAKASATTSTAAPNNNNNNNNNTNGTSNGHQENGGKLHSKENGQKKDSIKAEAEEKSPKSNGITNGNVTNNNNINSHHHQNGNGTTMDSTTKTTTTTMDKIIDDTKKVLTVTDGATTGKMALNGAATEPAVGATTPAPAAASEGKKLNLPMTAAEMRAQLAARKKYDPKNDVCDLRKKYEIIQKM